MKDRFSGLFPEEERRVYSLISRNAGLKAREIARETGLDRKTVSRLLVSSALMRELSGPGIPVARPGPAAGAL